MVLLPTLAWAITQIETSKINTYVVLELNAIQSSKINTYAVLELNAVQTSKINTYVALAPPVTGKPRLIQ